MLTFYKFSHFKRYSSLLHAISTKSKQYPHMFSLALHTGETPEYIMQNRLLFKQELTSNDSLTFIVANQTHGEGIKVIDKAISLGWNSHSEAIKDCDALITNLPNVVLTVLTADCVPILLYDPKQKVVATVHAGWRGSQAEIVKKTVQKMNARFHCNAIDIEAGIGPSIGKCCYEVNKDVAQYFLHIPNVCKEKKDKYMLDLPTVNKLQLLDAGLKEKNIEMSNICTSCNVEDYFSYRKEKGCSGRFMSIIALQ
jgi:YfiH family protein